MNRVDVVALSAMAQGLMPTWRKMVWDAVAELERLRDVESAIRTVRRLEAERREATNLAARDSRPEDIERARAAHVALKPAEVELTGALAKLQPEGA